VIGRLLIGAGALGEIRTPDPRIRSPRLTANNQTLSGPSLVKPGDEDQRVRSVLSNRDWPPDPEMRSPRNGWNHARANRKIEVLNRFKDTLPAKQTQRLCSRFALSVPYAEVVRR
jgi:hypothetical protein